MTSAEQTDADFGTVVDWLEGRLDTDAATRVEALARAGVPDVVATVAWWRRFHAAAVLPTEPVPDALAARLRALDQASPAAGPAPAPSIFDKLGLGRFVGAVQATWSFDSLQAPGLAMARSSADTTRQLVCSGPGLDVALDLSEPHDDGFSATAQLLPLDDGADAGGVRVATWARTGLVDERRSDPLGRVELGVLPADVVVVEVDRTPAWPALHAELDLRRPG